MAQVLKRSERRRVVETARRLVDGAPVPGTGTPHADPARGEVRDGDRVERLYAACACVPCTADDAGHGGGDHGPWLDHTRTAVV